MALEHNKINSKFDGSQLRDGYGWEKRSFSKVFFHDEVFILDNHLLLCVRKKFPNCVEMRSIKSLDIFPLLHFQQTQFTIYGIGTNLYLYLTFSTN